MASLAVVQSPSQPNPLSNQSQPQQRQMSSRWFVSSKTRAKPNWGRTQATLTIYVGIFACFFLVNLSLFQQFRESLLIAEQPTKRVLGLTDGNKNVYGSTSTILSRESNQLGENTLLSNSTLELDQCRSYKSHQFSASSDEPKVSIDMQTHLALGGYQEIAKGSGEVTAAGSIVTALSQIQHSNGVYGTVGELGVHHGRFTSFLFAASRSTEALVVADLFEEHQNENIDLSGLGDYRKFVKGLSQYGLSEGDLHAVHRGNTGDLPFDWSEKANFAPFRLLSVDASHTAESTRRDLTLAFCNLLEGGIVILDDWFHPSWPGVVEGYFQFAHGGLPWEASTTTHSLSSPAATSAAPPLDALDVFPFLICESKLYLTNSRTFYEQYYNHLLEDPAFRAMMSPFSIEKERGKVKYEMNGVPYLRCPSRKEMAASALQELWAQKVY